MMSNGDRAVGSNATSRRTFRGERVVIAECGKSKIAGVLREAEDEVLGMDYGWPHLHAPPILVGIVEMKKVSSAHCDRWLPPKADRLPLCPSVLLANIRPGMRFASGSRSLRRTTQGPLRILTFWIRPCPHSLCTSVLILLPESQRMELNARA